MAQDKASDKASDKVNKKVFEVKVGEKTLKLAVKRPDQLTQQKAQLVYNRIFRESVKPSDGKSGAIVRAAVEGIIRDQKLWDDARQAEYEGLQKSLRENERKLVKGGIKLSEGREIAIQMRRDRNKLNTLLSERNSLDANTAEAQAENAKFNWLVAHCTLDAETGTPYFKSEDDYNTRADDPVAIQAANNLANIIYDLDDNWTMTLPENRWLKQWNYIDEKGRLVDRQHGHLVDTKGRKIDEDGFLLNAEGKRVDEDGNLIAEDGAPVEEPMPFLDEDGHPLLTETKAEDKFEEKPQDVKAKADAKTELVTV